MKIKKIIPILFISLILASCTKDFKEIDTNPQGFTTASDGALFNGIIESLVLSGNEQFYINNEILYKQSQLAALTKDAWGNFVIGTEDIWKNYYSIMPSVRELERRFADCEQTPSIINMKAMLKTVVAYKTFKLTDLFGDVPYSEAGYGFQDLKYLHPKYDSQRDIYLSLLEDLKWVDENIDPSAEKVEPFTSFSKFDKLFQGNLLIWQKFANSLRLRYAMRMAEKEPELAGDIIKSIIEDDRPVLLGYDFTSAKLESACIIPIISGFKNESLNWSFREHNGLRMGSNIWHLLSENDSADGRGIFDPRAYIFFEGDGDNRWKPFPQLPELTTPSAGGIPYEAHRDDAAYFNFKGNNCNYSPFNFFIIRDEDFMPIILMTGAEVHFIKAEAYFRGIGVVMDKDQADNEYMNGMNSSVEWWMKTAQTLKLPVSKLSFNKMIPIPSGLDAVTVMNHFGSWNATTEEEKLRFIYTQRWLDAFRQPWEAYAEARRTGMTPREGAAIAHYRMPYPPSESQYNTVNWSEAKTRQGGDEPGVKIWWIP
jgi:hypothetical protein